MLCMIFKFPSSIGEEVITSDLAQPSDDENTSQFILAQQRPTKCHNSTHQSVAQLLDITTSHMQQLWSVIFFLLVFLLLITTLLASLCFV